MDLIKQLGGYWKAKNTLGKMKASNEFHKNSGMCGFSYTESSIHNLEREILEYRRAHNIFEIEDVACYKNHINSSNTLFKFFHDNEYLDIISLLRHATPEEIKAGKRL